MQPDIAVEVWGGLACFTRPECKVERFTYPLPNPSAARGILSSIYSKPAEFFWQVTQIEVLNRIRYISFMRNEVKNKIGASRACPEIIIVDDTKESCGNDQKGRTQRQTVMLKDVRYRILARIIRRPGADVTDAQLYEQALRRIRAGKCFYQPSLGLKECAAYFEESDMARKPQDINRDIGYMLYDVFDLHDFAVRKEPAPYITLFKASLEGGVMKVPDFDSAEVLRPGGVRDA